jgi:hypothetical protein
MKEVKNCITPLHYEQVVEHLKKTGKKFETIPEILTVILEE